MNALVVCYSRSGTTRKVAEKLASILGARMPCDSEEIHDTTDRAGTFGYLRAGRDAVSKKLTVLEKVKYDPASYDIVIIGTPLWAGTVSAPVRTYCAQYSDRFRKVAFFCTGDSSSDSLFKEMASLCGKDPVSTLWLSRKLEVEADKYAEKTEEFINRIPV